MPCSLIQVVVAVSIGTQAAEAPRSTSCLETFAPGAFSLFLPLDFTFFVLTVASFSQLVEPQCRPQTRPVIWKRIGHFICLSLPSPVTLCPAKCSPSQVDYFYLLCCGCLHWNVIDRDRACYKLAHNIQSWWWWWLFCWWSVQLSLDS